MKFRLVEELGSRLVISTPLNQKRWMRRSNINNKLEELV